MCSSVCLARIMPQVPYTLQWARRCHPQKLSLLPGISIGFLGHTQIHGHNIYGSQDQPKQPHSLLLRNTSVKTHVLQQYTGTSGPIMMDSITSHHISNTVEMLRFKGTTNITHTHTHPFNGPFSRTTRVGRYQKGKTNLDFTEVRDSEWQWHQLGHMQVCISL